MQIHISPRNVELSASVHQYVAEKIGHLEHLNGRMLATHVVLWHDATRRKEEEYVVKVHLSLPGPDIYAESHGPDLFSAIDLVTDKCARQLRKYKTRIHDRRIGRARRAKAAARGER
jgi:putative sigma-54 modulation protein